MKQTGRFSINIKTLISEKKISTVNWLCHQLRIDFCRSLLYVAYSNDSSVNLTYNTAGSIVTTEHQKNIYICN